MPIDTSKLSDEERMQLEMLHTMMQSLPDEAIAPFIAMLEEEKARRGI